MLHKKEVFERLFYQGGWDRLNKKKCTFSVNKFVDDVEPIFLGSIEKRSLSVYILFFKTESLLEKEVKTLFFPISADIEKNGLLVAVLEVRVSSIVNEKLHNFERLFVVYENS